MKDLIKIDDVEKYYGQKNNITKAINRVSFNVKKGEFTAIMGPSGSGKTTLLNMIATIDNVTSGHIYYDNIDITEMNDDDLANFRKKNLGFVFQEFNLLDILTIKKILL
jgi:ABC-type antimicrobial peptide transport system, ATPase component